MRTGLFPLASPSSFPFPFPLPLLNVSFFLFLCSIFPGKFPFGGKTNEEIAMNVVGSVLRFPADVSTRLKELITAMLAKRGSKRIRLNEVMDHPWVIFLFSFLFFSFLFFSFFLSSLLFSSLLFSSLLFSSLFLSESNYFLPPFFQLAPLNDPGSSLMISHRSYMQAAGLCEQLCLLLAFLTFSNRSS